MLNKQYKHVNNGLFFKKSKTKVYYSYLVYISFIH